jgi:hypothetical protein
MMHGVYVVYWSWGIRHMAWGMGHWPVFIADLVHHDGAAPCEASDHRDPVPRHKLHIYQLWHLSAEAEHDLGRLCALATRSRDEK